jgi:hypothetical protein
VSETSSAWLQGIATGVPCFNTSLGSLPCGELEKGEVVRLRTHRKRATRFGAAGTAVAAFLASLAALIGASVAPAGAGTSGPTTYEADCTTSLAAGQVAPFVQGLDVNGAPEPPLSPTGLRFGVSGAATGTVIGPVLAGLEQAVPGGTPTIGVEWTEAVGSTDGTATGTFSYTSPTFSPVPALGRQIGGVSWTSGSTTLTAAPGTFVAGDQGRFVAGPSGGGINPQSQITAVSGIGDAAFISVATTAAAGPVAIGTGENMTFTDPAFSTGNVFTATGVPGRTSNIGVTSVTRVIVTISLFGTIPIPVPFGGAPGVGTTNCLLTGWDAGGNPGPAQAGALAPALPFGTAGITPLVAASGGFISQPGTTQTITPPAAAFYPPAARGRHK